MPSEEELEDLPESDLKKYDKLRKKLKKRDGLSGAQAGQQAYRKIQERRTQEWNDEDD